MDDDIVIKNEICIEAQRLLEDVTYSSKSHYEAARYWNNFNTYLGILIILFATISSSISYSVFDIDASIAGSLAIIVAIITGINTFLNFNERVVCHQNAGNEYNSLSGRIRRLINIECKSIPVEPLYDKLQKFGEERDQMNRDAPPIPRFAYHAGKKGIQNKETEYSVDSSETTHKIKK